MKHNTEFVTYVEHIVDVLSPVPIWLLCKQYPDLLKDCKRTIKLMACLYSHEFIQMCNKCNNLCENKAVHLVFDCTCNENLRLTLWHAVYQNFGHDIYMSLIQLEPRKQIVCLCFGLCHLLISDLDRERCLKLAVKYLSQMIW